MVGMDSAGRSGFTLLEVMAALTLTGLVIMAALALYGNSYTVYQHSMTRGKLENVTLLIYQRVAEQLGVAYQYPFYDQRSSSFQGTASAFRMLTDGENGIAIEELMLTDGKLVYKKESLRNPEEKREETILTGVTGEFQYIDESAEAWRSDWTEDRAYPALLRLDLQVHSKSNRKDRGGDSSLRQDLPPLVFPIMVGREYGEL
jgi:prepilin-type N-terminal cleavage/methylation domain-containing protein